MRHLLCISTLLSIVCALAIRSVPSFDDAFARNKMIVLSAAAYTDSPQQCVENRLAGNVTGINHFNCDSSNQDICASISGVVDSEKAIFIAFRGSVSNQQILIETEENTFDKRVSFVGGGTVSEYFNHGFVGLWRAGLKNDFLLLTQKYPGYQLWITGHSLGAAMASLAATYINQLGMFDSAQIRLVTFGEPRVGDAGYAAEVDKLPYVYRVIYAADIVPHMPFRVMGYEHHRTEIWYNNTMAAPIFKACKAGDEDQNCSDGQWDLSMTDHRQYYERIVPEWGAAGCA